MRAWWHPQRNQVAAGAVVVALIVAGSVAWARSGSGSAVDHRVPTFGASTAEGLDNRQLEDIGDPDVVTTPGGYAVFWTTDWSANVPTAVSTDMVHWSRVPDALPRLPDWARVVSPPPQWGAAPGVSTKTWGPSVRKVGDRWMMYYSTEADAAALQCLSVASSASPTGPYTDESIAPLVCQSSVGGDIDPSIVTSSQGHYSLIWKNDGNAVGATVSIWEQALDTAGTAVTGPRVRLVSADQAWEHGIIEGPAMVADTRGGWWLFYSGGSWQSDTYNTGVSWCVTVAGPCAHPDGGPVLSSVPTAVSPGGLDTFIDHQGRMWASYSAFPDAPRDAQAAYESPRVLELAPLLSH